MTAFQICVLLLGGGGLLLGSAILLLLIGSRSAEAEFEERLAALDDELSARADRDH